jgi:putative SOS response-associated peptidase YedK
MPHLITVSAWGFVPEWAAGRQDVKPLINARAETITTTPFLRDAFKKKRCFVLADGFYKWRRTKEGKVPYRIAFKTEEPFAFAGMWSAVHDVARQPQTTFDIITTMFNERVAPMHPRMPVILHAADEAGWLDPQRSLSEVQAMLVPFPAEQLTVYKVSTRVNATAHHTPEVLQCV